MIFLYFFFFLLLITTIFSVRYFRAGRGKLGHLYRLDGRPNANTMIGQGGINIDRIDLYEKYSLRSLF